MNSESLTLGLTRSCQFGSVVFIPPTAGLSGLDRLQMGLPPLDRVDVHYELPLQEVFSEVTVFDLDRQYALQGAEAANRALVGLVRRTRPDYVLWHALMYELSEAAAAAIRASGSCLVGWFSDDEFRFDDYSRWWAPHLDWCLTTDQRVMWAYEAAGGRPVRMMWGSDPTCFRPVDVPFRHDVSFVGYRFGSRGDWVAALRRRGLDVAAYGRGWPDGYLTTEAMVEVFSASKVNLCFVGADVQSEHHPVIKGRIFDVCMSGGFLLCETVPGIEEFFVPDKELVLFCDVEDAAEKTRYYLSHESERRAIAAAGYARARRDHKQADRFRQAFATIAQSGEYMTPTAGLLCPSCWSEAALRRRAQWHFSWAKALSESGSSAARLKEELRLCLTDDPRHADARRLAARHGCFGEPERLSAVAKDAMARAMGHVHGYAGRVPALGRAKRHVRSKMMERRIAALKRHEAAKDMEFIATDVLDGALDFARSLEVPSEGVGRYRYSAGDSKPTLYASACAVLLRHLLGDLGELGEAERDDWAAYLNGFQCEDGLYRDPGLPSAKAERPYGQGWCQLTVLVTAALACLASRPGLPFAFLRELHEQGAASAWVSSLDWRRRPAQESSAVMHYVALLQYQRDADASNAVDRSLNEIFDFLEESQDPSHGLWAFRPIRSTEELALAGRVSGNVSNGFFYDGRYIRRPERMVKGYLNVQDGPGASPGRDAGVSEDFSALMPLARLAGMGIRRDLTAASLRTAIHWSHVHRMPSGGVRSRLYENDSSWPILMDAANEPDMFSTWLRSLSVAYAVAALGDMPTVASRLRWVACPGYQYWSPKAEALGPAE